MNKPRSIPTTIAEPTFSLCPIRVLLILPSVDSLRPTSSPLSSPVSLRSFHLSLRPRLRLPLRKRCEILLLFSNLSLPNGCAGGNNPGKSPVFTNTEPVEESRHLRVNSFNEIYVFLFEIEGLFYAVTIAIAHYYAPSCKAAFIKLLCRRGNVWRTPPARGMRLILAVYITETFHSATQLPSNTKYSPPPCWFGKMNSEGVAGGYSTYGLSEIIETLVNSREREVIERRELLWSADLEMNGWPEASGWREVWKRKGDASFISIRIQLRF